MNTREAEILVVSPHPDDAEYGCAGSVARWVRQGKAVVYIICTSGGKGTGDTSLTPEIVEKMREEEQRCAAKVLGVRDVVFLHFTDQGLEDTPEFRKELVKQIRTFRPHTVVTADPYRRYIWHRDHRITGRVTLDAVYPYARDFLAYPDLWEQGIKPHIVEEVLTWAAEANANYVVDITDTFDSKMAALRCHKSQVGDNAELETWMRQRALEAAKGRDFELGEAFHREEIMW